MSAETATVERVLTQDEFDRFARLSGDDNPIHVDADFAARTRFGRTVAHGVFLYSILRGLADRLVPGGRQMSQEVRFPAPTYTGEAMRFTAAVEAREGTRVIVGYKVERVADGAVTCDGRTVLEVEA